MIDSESMMEKIDELKITVEEKEARIKELDRQVMELQVLLKQVLEYQVTNRWQFRVIKRAYEKWFYSRYAQMERQLKLEIVRMAYKNKELEQLLEDALEAMIKTNDMLQKETNTNEDQQPEGSEDENRQAD